MRVLQVCAEIFPLLKTGGLADVAGALPSALRAQGADVRVLLPGFAPILAALEDVVEIARLQPPAALAGAQPRLLRGHLPACTVEAYVIDAPHYYLRGSENGGGPYADANDQPYADNAQRFALLGWVGAELAQGLDPSWQPQVVHAHDWHAALAPAYVRAAAEAGKPVHSGTVFTVHNLAYQGLFDASQFSGLGLPAHFFNMHGVEYHGQLNFMKAGLHYADHITTVSPRYAREIQSPDQGCGLDGVLRERAHVLSGVLNGVDDTVWNPATDTLLAANYQPDRLAGKARCKRAVQEELGLEVDAKAALFCVVSRLTEQKGLHLVLQALPALLEHGAQGAQLAVLGSGDATLEAAFTAAAAARPGALALRIGYDEALAHRLIAGSDIILVPSRFEPCGLTQLYGLKYGTLPLVRRVGGLADSVRDTRLETLDSDATGFVFDDFSSAGLVAAAQRALALYRRPAEWKRVQQRAMRQSFDWQAAASHYMELYRSLAR